MEVVNNDELLPLIERLKSFREDISNCISKWSGYNLEDKLKYADDIFNKVRVRIGNLARNGGCGTSSALFYHANYEDLRRENKHMKELFVLLDEEHEAFISSHTNKYLGDEFLNCLMKLYKIEIKTGKISKDDCQRRSCSVIYDMFQGLPDLDETELADYNEDNDNYVFIRKQTEDMIDCIKKRDEVCKHLIDLKYCISLITETIDRIDV